MVGIFDIKGVELCFIWDVFKDLGIDVVFVDLLMLCKFFGVEVLLYVVVGFY